MEERKKDARRESIITDLEALVPKNHLLRKIDKVMGYDWLCERLKPYCCHDNGRPGEDKARDNRQRGDIRRYYSQEPLFSLFENRGSLTS